MDKKVPPVELKDNTLIITTGKPKVKLYSLTSRQITWSVRLISMILLAIALFTNNILLISTMIFLTIISMLLTITVTPIQAVATKEKL